MTAGEICILGVESSCDDTSAAVVMVRPGRPSGNVLSNVVLGQAGLHAAYGGIVPEIAARAHAERLDHAVERALGEAGLVLSAIQAVAVSAGPGLIGGVMAGVMFTKGLATARGLPLWGVNHLAAHALSPRLAEDLSFPYLMLLVSGGHCQFLAVEGPETFRRIGGTIDDAAGEAFDKVAKLIGLPQPGGPAIERAAALGDPERFAFPRPLMQRAGADVSFSGLKTAVRRVRDRLVTEQGGLRPHNVADIAASFQATVADVLSEKSRRALLLVPGARAFAAAGGVAANAAIRARLAEVAEASQLRFVAPPLRYCTDNGAIVAWAAAERMALEGAIADGQTIAPRPRWPLDTSAQPMLGGGRKGSKA